MRILLLTQHFPPDPGPQSRRWGMLATQFAARGHTVDVVVPRWESPAAAQPWTPPPGITVHPVRSFVKGIRLQRRIVNEALTAIGSAITGWRVARTEPRVDVVMGTVPALGALPMALLIGRGNRIPVIAEVRDAWPDILHQWREWGDTGTSEEGGARRPLVGLAMATLVPVICRVYTDLERAADQVVTTTDSLASIFRARGIAAAPVRNTSFGLVPGRLPETADRRDGTLRILYLGNVGRAQHLATAVRAAQLAQQRGVPVRLRIVGDGAESTAMRTFNERLGHPAEVVPRIDAADVAGQYEWADSILVCLRDWPGMDWTVPSKLYEALQSGRHVSASLRGETARIITEAGAGDVVPPEDPEALADLWAGLARDRSRLRVGTGGVDWVAHHVDAAALATRYLELVRAVIGRRDRRTGDAP